MSDRCINVNRGSRSAVILCALLALVVASVPACRGPEARRRVSRTGEVSVNPGINESYREEPDVETWEQRFESESREIFRERKRIVQTLGVQPGMAVADIGAGTGFFTKLLAMEVGPDGTVFAVDIKPEFIAHIKEQAANAGLHNVRTVLCAEDSVELPPASVDLVFTCDTYHHFEFPVSSLASIRRALKPGGELVVIDFERIEGQSRQWVLDHVRAGKQIVIDEITSAGFELIQEAPNDFLEENYILRFRKSG